MTVTPMHPERVNGVDVHHQVAVTHGSRNVYLAAALDAVGATAADLAKATEDIVDLDDVEAEQFVVGRERAAAVNEDRVET